MSQETPLETRKAILEVILANHRPQAEIEEISKNLQGVASHITRSGFDFFVDDLNSTNEEVGQIPFANDTLSKEEFAGAVVNADILDVTRFSNAYGILPVSLSIGVSEEKWPVVRKKFGGSENHSSITVPRKRLLGSAYGLERFGLGLYRLENDPRMKDLITIQQAKWVYSPHAAEYECGFENIDMNLRDIRLWMEHRLAGELASSVRDDTLNEYDIAKELCTLLDHYRENITPYIIKYKKDEFDSHDDYKEFVLNLSGHFKFYKEKIRDAVNSFMQIENILGKKSMACLMFHLGGNYVPKQGQPYEITEDNEDTLTSEQRIDIVKNAIGFPFRHLDELAECMRILPPCAEEILELNKEIGDDRGLLKNVIKHDQQEYTDKLIMPHDIYAVLNGRMPKKKSYAKGDSSQKFSA